MSNGRHIKISLFGESHGPVIGITINGLKPGITIDNERIDQALIKRQGYSLGNLVTPRQEPNIWRVLSGLFNGKTTGAPLTITVDNVLHDSSTYQQDIVRPGHVDYFSNQKYSGFNDFRGGGNFGGRMTVVLVILGEILRPLLERVGIYVGARIVKFLDEIDLPKSSSLNEISREAIVALNQSLLPTLLPSFSSYISEQSTKIKDKNDSCGAMIEILTTPLPIGLGGPSFDSVESRLSSVYFGIPGVKSVEFGLGVEYSEMLGSMVNDHPQYVDGTVHFDHNNCGGLTGGLTTGQSLIARVGIRPTPTIKLPQGTINIKTKENIIHTFTGNHDVCFALRVPIILEAVTIWVLADLLGEDL